VVGIKLFAAFLHEARSATAGWLVALACLVLSALAFGYKLFRLYSAELMTNARLALKKFLLWSLAPAIAAGACFAWLANQGYTPADVLADAVFPSTWRALRWWPMVVFALMVYGGAIAAALVRATPADLGRATLIGPNRPFAFRVKDFGAWAAAVIVFATLVWFGAQSYARHHDSELNLISELCVKDLVACVPDAKRRAQPVRVNKEILLVVFGTLGRGEVEGHVDNLVRPPIRSCRGASAPQAADTEVVFPVKARETVGLTTRGACSTEKGPDQPVAIKRVQ
jgi:hypothetical protein